MNRSHRSQHERALAPAPAPRDAARVLLAGKPTAMLSPGGGEVQMLATARALAAAGVDARLWRPWEDALEAADCLHLFGSEPEHLPLVEAARRKGVPVALSTIAWFALANCRREPRSLPGRLAASARFLARAAFPRLPSWRRRLYHAVDLLLPNSNAEAAQLVRYFGVPLEKIHITPNGADGRFATAGAEPFVELVGVRNFVLYAGRIEPRKNQLNFLRAMRGADVSIVVLGDAVPGHEWYFDACRRVAGRRVQFVPRLDHDDPRLAAAYAACGCLVLASWFETPGLAALEAAMSGAPLVLPEGGCGKEYFGDRALYVRPGDLRGIRRAVHVALARGRDESLAEHVRNNFSWNAAARAVREAYEKII